VVFGVLCFGVVARVFGEFLLVAHGAPAYWVWVLDGAGGGWFQWFGMFLGVCSGVGQVRVGVFGCW
jgi:hypothetical protein